jgi:phosphotransferase system enzyme I (PtsP)
VPAKIYARGEAAKVDAVLDLVRYVAGPHLLAAVLDDLPRRIADVMSADICSIYLLEDEELVMRGSAGFPTTALGEVRLAVGEGLTGTAVQLMRPVVKATAPTDRSFRSFPELDEERFPVFLAVPIAGPAGPLGALVVQRISPPFDDGDVELAAALTAPVAAVAERAHLTEALRGARKDGRTAKPRVTLPGRSIAGGRAVGQVFASRRPTGVRVSSGLTAEWASSLGEEFDGACRLTQRSLRELEARAGAAQVDVSFSSLFRTILEDSRLKERSLELVEKDGLSLDNALCRVGAEAAKAAASQGDAFGVSRALAIDDICEALAMFVRDPRQDQVPHGAVLVGDGLSIYDFLVPFRRRPVAVILSTLLPMGPYRELVQLFGIPVVANISGLFRWVEDGDLALVDGDHGLVRLNPGRAELALFRNEKKSGR